VLAKTPRQYRRAKKTLFAILHSLQLRLAMRKTKMGKLTSFHFLGVQFDVAQTSSLESHATTAISLHPRSSRRALDRINTQRYDASNTVDLRAYLSRWAAWWHTATGIPLKTIFYSWIIHNASDAEPDALWIGVPLWYQRELCVNV
jgi:hypothetical protein